MAVSSLITIIAFIAILGIVVWLIMQVPMPAMFKNLIYAIVAIFVILWLVSAVGGHPILVLH